MNHACYARALDSLDMAMTAIQTQLRTADHCEGILALQILEQLAKTKALIGAVYAEGVQP